MANRDLRDWIEGVRAAGELKAITGAEPKEEIVIILDEIERVEAEARRLCFGGVIGDSALPNRTGPEIVSG